MKSGLGGRRRGALAGMVLVLTASCGGANPVGESPATPISETSQSTAPGPLATEAPVTAETQGEPAEVQYGECGTAATMVEMNVPIDIVMPDSKVFLCVEILEGVGRITFEVSEMTAPLNLFVGYPDLATLESGGGRFWASEQAGRDDEVIVIEPGATGFVDPGSYFVEISGGASAESASFVLTVNTS